MDRIDESTRAMENHLDQYRRERRALKFNTSLHANFEKAVDPSIVTIPSAVLVTEQFEVYADTDIEDLLHEASKQLQNCIESYEGTESGWIISNSVALDTTVWQLDPLRASIYHPLLAWIRNTKCVINVKNKYGKCFKYAVLAGLYESSDPRDSNRVSSYTYCEVQEGAPDFSMQSIGKFVENNIIPVNVYAVDEKERKATKRKATSDGPAPKRRRNEFIDHEADDDEESDEYGNLSDFIDDDVTLNNQMDQEEEEEKEENDDNKRGIAYPVRVTKQELSRNVNLLLALLHH